MSNNDSYQEAPKTSCGSVPLVRLLIEKAMRAVLQRVTRASVTGKHARHFGGDRKPINSQQSSSGRQGCQLDRQRSLRARRYRHGRHRKGYGLHYQQDPQYPGIRSGRCHVEEGCQGSRTRSLVW